MTMTRDKIEEAVHDLVKLWDSQHVGEDDFNEEMCRIEGIFRAFALAERALEPQGQALPELPKADAFRDRIEHYDLYMKDNGTGDLEPLITLDKAIAYARAYASQLALPAGPVSHKMVAMLEEICSGEVVVSTEAVRQIIYQFDQSFDESAAGPVPEGWKLVPIRPTEEMLAAADKGDRRYTDRNYGKDHCTQSQGAYDNYIDMVRAAPQPASPSPAVAQPVAGFKTQPTAEQVATVRERLEAAGLQKVAQPVADERAEYERMLRTGYQHDNVRRQERGLASSDELTQEQEREIAERVALKFPSDAPAPREPIAFSCAKRAAHPTSWTMTCDKHCGDGAKCLRASPAKTDSPSPAVAQPVAPFDPVTLRKAKLMTNDGYQQVGVIMAKQGEPRAYIDMGRVTWGGAAVAQPVDGFKIQPTAEQVATVRERLEAAGLQKVAQPVADERLWSDLRAYLEGGLESPGPLEADGSIEARALIARMDAARAALGQPAEEGDKA